MFTQPLWCVCVCVCVLVRVCFRKEFVEAYLRYVFSDSVSEQYSAFSSGFLKVCGGEILSLFQPSELMAMVVGNNNYNWEEMEKVRVNLWDKFLAFDTFTVLQICGQICFC